MYQTELVWPLDHAWTGSPASFVAASVVPACSPDSPVSALALEKSSFAGAPVSRSASEKSPCAGTLPPSIAIRYVVPATARKCAAS